MFELSLTRRRDSDSLNKGRRTFRAFVVLYVFVVIEWLFGALFSAMSIGLIGESYHH